MRLAFWGAGAWADLAPGSRSPTGALSTWRTTIRSHAAAPPLLGRALDGDRVALARCVSIVENESAGSVAILEECFRRGGRASRLGITGPPGAGKSTLSAKVAAALRHRGARVAIVAVDPTSPFTGGALLGDRVRMSELAGDEGVFIRSMASRGSAGGLAVNTAQVCDVLDAAGFDSILIETVGVGQSELEVAGTADSTVVVLVPESGDGVQAMKAGLMEIGDLFVVNKADREGAERAAMAIKTALELRAGPRAWTPPVLLTVASTGQGVDEVVAQAGEHLRFLRRSGQLEEKRRQRLQRRLEDMVRDRQWLELRGGLPDGLWDQAVHGLAERRLTPFEALEQVMGAAGASRPKTRGARRTLPRTGPRARPVARSTKR